MPISATIPSARDRDRARRSRAEAGLAARTRSSSAASTTTTRSCREMFDIWMRLLRAGRQQRAVAASRTIWRSSRNLSREAIARGVAPGAARVRAALHAGGPPGAPARSPICSSIRFPTTRTRPQRCALGGPAGADRAGGLLCRPGRRQPALRVSAFRAGHAARLRSTRRWPLKLARDRAALSRDPREGRAATATPRRSSTRRALRATSKPLT